MYHEETTSIFDGSDASVRKISSLSRSYHAARMRIRSKDSAIARVALGAGCSLKNASIRSASPWVVKLSHTQEITDASQLTSADVLSFEMLSDGKAIIDATEQVVYRASNNDVRKQYYSGKKKPSR